MNDGQDASMRMDGWREEAGLQGPQHPRPEPGKGATAHLPRPTQ